MTTYYEMNEDFLAHYGVLGMKWGVHRAKETRSARSLSTKKKYLTDKSSGGLLSRRKAYKSNLNKARTNAMNRLYSRNSKELNKKVATQGMGKTIGKSLLLGSYGALKYDQARVDKGNGRAKSAVKGLLKQVGDVAAHNIPSRHEYLVNRGSRTEPTSDRHKVVNKVLDKASKAYTKPADKVTSTVKNAIKRKKK